jgi:meso-butanediol dehydrogenase / (S,S)-butanediol dehydrogenase / diacetyl reductase
VRPDRQLDGKVALVTGATRGLAAGIVRHFAREGAAVAFTGRSEDGRRVEEEVRAAGGRALFLQGSADSERDVAAAVQATVDTYGSLTTLVNSAIATDLTVGGHDSTVEDIDTDLFDEIVRTGLNGTMWASKYAIPHMKRAGGGAIVNISATSSVLAIRTRPAYQATKGAINSLTRQMAVDFGRFGIRSNAIVVGFIDTREPAITELLANKSYAAAIRECILLPRFGAAEDIAATAAFLASDEASYITGVLLPVDGGMTCHQAVPTGVVRGD